MPAGTVFLVNIPGFEKMRKAAMILYLRTVGIEATEKRPGGRNYYVIRCADGDIYVKGVHMAAILCAVKLNNHPWRCN